MQAFSGIMSITGEPDGAPLRCGVSFLDLTTGIFCAFGIVNALLHRVSTGLGQRVDGSLLETAVTLLNYHAEGYLLTGNQPKPLGSSHPSLSPYRTFKCGDGQWIFIAGANDRFWQRLAPALGLAEMVTDPRFAKNIERVKNRRELEAALEAAIARQDREPLLKVLEDAGVPATPVNTVEQVMDDAQTTARSMIERVVHPKLGEIPVVGTPDQVLAHEGGRPHAPRRSRASTPTRSWPSTSTPLPTSPPCARRRWSCSRAPRWITVDPQAPVHAAARPGSSPSRQSSRSSLRPSLSSTAGPTRGGTVYYTTDLATIPPAYRDSARDIGAPTPGPVRRRRRPRRPGS